LKFGFKNLERWSRFATPGSPEELEFAPESGATGAEEKPAQQVAELRLV